MLRRRGECVARQKDNRCRVKDSGGVQGGGRKWLGGAPNARRNAAEKALGLS